MNFETVANQYLQLQSGTHRWRGLRRIITGYGKIWVKDLRVKYKPASIGLVVTLAKQVLASPKNENGLPPFRCIGRRTSSTCR
jgi:hypothetical protein